MGIAIHLRHVHKLLCEEYPVSGDSLQNPPRVLHVSSLARRLASRPNLAWKARLFGDFILSPSRSPKYHGSSGQCHLLEAALTENLDGRYWNIRVQPHAASSVYTVVGTIQALASDDHGMMLIMGLYGVNLDPSKRGLRGWSTSCAGCNRGGRQQQSPISLSFLWPSKVLMAASASSFAPILSVRSP